MQNEVSSNNNNPSWIHRLIEDSFRERNYATNSRHMSINLHTLVWYYCKKGNLHKDGIPGQTARVLNMYIGSVIRNSMVSSRDPEELVTHFNANLPLYVMCALRLVAKIEGGPQVSIQMIRDVLLLENLHYSVFDVCKTEADMLTSLGYQLPLTTGVEMAHMLAEEVEVPGNLVPIIVNLQNLAELRRNSINNLMSVWTSIDNVFVPTLHLAAGSVIAAMRCASYKARHIARLIQRLALYLVLAPHHLALIAHAVVYVAFNLGGIHNISN